MRLNEINYVTQLLGKEKDAKQGGFRKRIAEYFGISETEVQRYWSYNKLIDPIKEAVKNGLSFSVAMEFSSLDDKQQKFAFNELKKNNKLMTKYVREMKKTMKTATKEKEELKEGDVQSETKLKPEKSVTAKHEDISSDITDGFASELNISTEKEVQPQKEDITFQDEIKSKKEDIEKDAIEFCIEFLNTKKEELMLIDADDKTIARQRYIDKVIANCQKDLI